jgi:aspartate carbamoyltransferase regulatory subunit
MIKKLPSVQTKSQNNVAEFFLITRRGIVNYEFVPPGQTVNGVYYFEVLEKLREKVDGNDPNVLPTTHGSCITTMHLLTRHGL